jgi:hypothetical protein
MKPQHKATLALPFALATIATCIYFLVTYPTISAVIFLILFTVALVILVWYWLLTFFVG